jgi:hypothetical protein
VTDVRVFVTQRRGGCGVALVPKAQLAALRDDGFREATAAEVAAWYRLRGQAPPAVVREQARSRPLAVPVVFGISDGESAGRTVRAA